MSANNSGFRSSTRLQRVPQINLVGKKLLVVGGTGGLGRAIASLARQRGSEVTVVGRKLRDAPGARMNFVQADLSLMARASRVGRELRVEETDVVLFTSGIFASPTREETAEGVEQDMAVSFLNRLAILTEIHGRLGAGRPAGSPQSRVFVMGSPGFARGNPEDLNSESGYKPMTAHRNTVAGNEALALAGSRMFPGPSFFGLGPGLIKTGIRENYLGRNRSGLYRFTESAIGAFFQSPGEYSERILPLMFNPDLDGLDGVLFNRKARRRKPTRGFDAEYADHFLKAAGQLLNYALANTH